ncbi:trypsin-like cysteine/serine peptidase domain-containing protein [Podospora didyma]|uniref:Trypsin-like cysteine/serine peptidase domain-containing protein n=1 Tax=Podospora didyma TaxID=330526 RepID=A0AAE0K5N7_9PEZI|nr:trypsin-like cysteine/serine peptidase domain-containing protein [Podospora didyma]
MRFHLSFAATWLLAISDLTWAAPFNITDTIRLPIPPIRWPICTLPPPTPKLMRITHDELIKRISPFMPGFDPKGISNNTGFRPPKLNFTRIPETRLTRDIHLKQFLTIAPRSTQLFIHSQVLDVTRKAFPYSTMGKVFLRDGTGRVGHCTGTSVGHNLLLTANHCVPWDSPPDRKWTMEFVPGYDGLAEPASDAKPFGSAFAVYCVGVDDEVIDGRDYALCKLNSNIGETDIGWLRWKASGDDAFYYNGDWSSVGYPYTFRDGNVPTTDSAPVKIEKVNNDGTDGKVLMSAPYVEQGWSGGPLFGYVGDPDEEEYGPWIVGVVSASVSMSFYEHIFADYTFHAAGVRMGQLIEWGWKEWIN